MSALERDLKQSTLLIAELTTFRSAGFPSFAARAKKNEANGSNSILAGDSQLAGNRNFLGSRPPDLRVRKRSN